MNIKKLVIERITNLLQNEYNNINHKIFENKWKFKKLEEEQTILKRERAKLQQLINDVKGTK